MNWETIAAMTLASYFWGWFVTDDQSLVSPIFNRVRLKLELLGWPVVHHKFVCRVCSGFEASLVAMLVLGAPEFWRSVVWLAAATGAHRLVRDLISGDDE